VFVADGLAFLGELRAVPLAIAEDEAAGSGEKAINGRGGEDGAFAEPARDAGRGCRWCCP
jgi:hypothetical protein